MGIDNCRTRNYKCSKYHEGENADVHINVLTDRPNSPGDGFREVVFVLSTTVYSTYSTSFGG